MQQRDRLVEVVACTAGAHEVSNFTLRAANLVRRQCAVILMLRASSSRQEQATDTNVNGDE